MSYGAIITSLRSQELIMLRDLAKVSGDAICAGSTKFIRGQPAFYGLWWVGDQHLLGDAWQAYQQKQPQDDQIAKDSCLNDGHPHLTNAQYTPLFAGMAENLSKRISAHMKLGMDGRLSNKVKGQRAKYNHQLRLGLEALFPDERHPIQLIFDHVGLTFTIASDSNIAKEGPKFSQEAHEVLKPVMVNIPT